MVRWRFFYNDYRNKAKGGGIWIFFEPWISSSMNIWKDSHHGQNSHFDIWYGVLFVKRKVRWARAGCLIVIICLSAILPAIFSLSPTICVLIISPCLCWIHILHLTRDTRQVCNMGQAVCTPRNRSIDYGRPDTRIGKKFFTILFVVGFILFFSVTDAMSNSPTVAVWEF